MASLTGCHLALANKNVKPSFWWDAQCPNGPYVLPQNVRWELATRCCKHITKKDESRMLPVISRTGEHRPKRTYWLLPPRRMTPFSVLTKLGTSLGWPIYLHRDQWCRLHEAKVTSRIATQKMHLEERHCQAWLLFAPAVASWKEDKWRAVVFTDEATYCKRWDQQKRVWCPEKCRKVLPFLLYQHVKASLQPGASFFLGLAEISLHSFPRFP